MIFNVNGRNYDFEVNNGDFLVDVLRNNGFTSVKKGCDTTNCGLCTILIDDKPVLSCSVLAVRVNGKITTLEGLQEKAEKFGAFLAEQGADQCGYCSPGFIMNVLALESEYDEIPTDDEIIKYLSGNLCRCTGYQGQLRAIKNYLKAVKS